MPGKHHVVILGGGFGGLYAAQALRKAPVELTLLDRRNFHLFQPLLYQVATGALSPANIAAPLRQVLRRQRNATVLLGEAADFDLANREVLLTDGRLRYDSLVVATGARHHYFGHPEWEACAPGLKTLEDATLIRRRVLTAFEEAERHGADDKARALLTFVIVGGGPTGVELAGAVAEVARSTLRGNFRRINPASALIYLIEGGPHLLPTFKPVLQAKAARSLERMGVTVRCGAVVTDVCEGRVTLRGGDRTEVIESHTVLWGAGVQASPLAAKLARQANAELDRAGRLMVAPDCTLPGHPEVFVIGDMVHFAHQGGQPLPGVAPVAMQMGSFVAATITRRLEGKAPLGAFRYKDKGSMATIGRAAAVADLGWTTLSGYPAWLAWLFVHLLYLIAFENRVLVVFQWAWNYFTRGRAARLITEVPEGKRE